MTDDATIQAIREDISEIKHGIKNVQQSQNLVAERLTRLEERHENNKAAIERAFNSIADHGLRVQKLEIEGPDARDLLKRLESTEQTVNRVDGEHKKYMYIGIGVALLASALWTAGSAYIVSAVKDAKETMEMIPQLAAKQKRQDAINRVILKKIGSDIDYIE